MISTIRQEIPADTASIRMVLECAFGRRNEADLVNLIQQTGKALVSMVAVLDSEIVGHILLSPITIESAPDDCMGLGLGPLAVSPIHQRKGIGSQLVEAGIRTSASIGCSIMVVLGDPTYYSRFGFSRASNCQLQNEYGVDNKFMALELQAGILDKVQGMVRYVSEFKALETFE